MEPESSVFVIIHVTIDSLNEKKVMESKRKKEKERKIVVMQHENDLTI